MDLEWSADMQTIPTTLLGAFASPAFWKLVRTTPRTRTVPQVEIKNMNSFSAMQRAIDYEIARQSELLEAGKDGEIVLETRLWEEGAQRTVSGGATFGQHTLSFGTGCEVFHTSVGRKQLEEPDLVFATIPVSRSMLLLGPAMVFSAALIAPGK
jgi:hypothetical protein